MFDHIPPLWAPNNSFTIAGGVVSNPEDTDFAFHIHSYDEIYIFFEGSATYRVEGITYENLQPYDIILIKRSKYHCIKHNVPLVPYNRLIISLSPYFYELPNCSRFVKIFDNDAHSGSLIPAALTKSSGIYDCLKRYNGYFNSSPDKYPFLAPGFINELVYLISLLDLRAVGTKNDLIQNIIDHINSDPSFQLTVEQIAEKYFISTRHLNRVFKEETGLTVKQYIIRKKFYKTQQLYLSGMNITEACTEAGFSSYNSFYTAFVTEYGKSPKKALNSFNLAPHNVEPSSHFKP